MYSPPFCSNTGTSSTPAFDTGDGRTGNPFLNVGAFADHPESQVYPADVNGDGLIDLVVGAKSGEIKCTFS